MSYDITMSELPEQPVVVVRGHATTDDIAGFLGQAFGSVMDVVSAQGRKVAGPPFARYGTMDETGWDIEAGFPVDGPVRSEGQVEPSVLPGGHAARLVHAGPYDTVSAGWEALSAWVSDNGYVATHAPWECYLDEPAVKNPRTLIVMPCARPVAGS